MSTTVNGVDVDPGTAMWIDVSIATDLGGNQLTIPLYVINGDSDGQTLWIQGLIHGNEFVGGVALRDVLLEISPQDVSGTIVGSPVTNVSAYANQIRESPLDDKDPIRNIPPRSDGKTTYTDVFSDKLRDTILDVSDVVVDLHETGAPFGRSPGFAIFPRDGGPIEAASKHLAEVTGLPDAVGIDLTTYQVGMWADLADHGIPSITTEAGANQVEKGTYRTMVRAISNIVDDVCETSINEETKSEPVTVHDELRFVFSESGGMFKSFAEPQESVVRGELIGEITDFKGETKERLEAPEDGIILACYTDSVVRPGQKPFMMGCPE